MAHAFQELGLILLLVETSSTEQRPPVPSFLDDVLSALGVAGQGHGMRQAMPHVITAEPAAQLLLKLQLAPQGGDVSPWIQALLAQEQGLGRSQVVSVDALLLLAVFACTGSLQQRLHLAFWTLDSNCRGCISLQQVLSAIPSLLSVAAAAKLWRGLHSSGDEQGSEALRMLLVKVASRAYMECDVTGTDQLPEEQFQAFVMRAAAHISAAVVEAAAGPAPMNSSTPMQGQPSQPQQHKLQPATAQVQLASPGGSGEAAHRRGPQYHLEAMAGMRHDDVPAPLQLGSTGTGAKHSRGTGSAPVVAGMQHTPPLEGSTGLASERSSTQPSGAAPQQVPLAPLLEPSPAAATSTAPSVPSLMQRISQPLISLGHSLSWRLGYGAAAPAAVAGPTVPVPATQRTSGGSQPRTVSFGDLDAPRSQAFASRHIAGPMLSTSSSIQHATTSGQHATAEAHPELHSGGSFHVDAQPAAATPPGPVPFASLRGPMVQTSSIILRHHGHAHDGDQATPTTPQLMAGTGGQRGDGPTAQQPFVGSFSDEFRPPLAAGDGQRGDVPTGPADAEAAPGPPGRHRQQLGRAVATRLSLPHTTEPDTAGDDVLQGAGDGVVSPSPPSVVVLPSPSAEHMAASGSIQQQQMWGAGFLLRSLSKSFKSAPSSPLQQQQQQQQQLRQSPQPPAHAPTSSTSQLEPAGDRPPAGPTSSPAVQVVLHATPASAAQTGQAAGARSTLPATPGSTPPTKQVGRTPLSASAKLGVGLLRGTLSASSRFVRRNIFGSHDASREATPAAEEVGHTSQAGASTPTYPPVVAHAVLAPGLPSGMLSTQASGMPASASVQQLAGMAAAHVPALATSSAGMDSNLATNSAAAYHLATRTGRAGLAAESRGTLAADSIGGPSMTQLQMGLPSLRPMAGVSGPGDAAGMLGASSGMPSEGGTTAHDRELHADERAQGQSPQAGPSAKAVRWEAAAERAEMALSAQARAQRTTSGRPAAASRAGRAHSVQALQTTSSGPAPAAPSTLRGSIQSSVQEAVIKIFLTCGIALLSIISLLLADTALVVFVYKTQGWPLDRSLIVVAGIDAVLVMLLLGILVVKSWLASRRAAHAVSTQAGNNQGSVLDTVITIAQPVMRLLGVAGGAGAAAAHQHRSGERAAPHAPASQGGAGGEVQHSGSSAQPEDSDGGGRTSGHGAGRTSRGMGMWTSRLHSVWAAVGKLAGFDAPQLHRGDLQESSTEQAGLASPSHAVDAAGGSPAAGMWMEGASQPQLDIGSSAQALPLPDFPPSAVASPAPRGTAMMGPAAMATPAARGPPLVMGSAASTPFSGLAVQDLVSATWQSQGGAATGQLPHGSMVPQPHHQRYASASSLGGGSPHALIDMLADGSQRWAESYQSGGTLTGAGLGYQQASRATRLSPASSVVYAGDDATAGGMALSPGALSRQPSSNSHVMRVVASPTPHAHSTLVSSGRLVSATNLPSRLLAASNGGSVPAASTAAVGVHASSNGTEPADGTHAGGGSSWMRARRTQGAAAVVQGSAAERAQAQALRDAYHGLA